MTPTVATAVRDGHRVLPEMAKGSEAKADLRKTETAAPSDWKKRIGAAVQEVRRTAGWSLNELSGAIGRDERQIARWERGEETPQLDRYFAVEILRGPLAIAVAKLAGRGVEIETVVRVRRQVA